VPPIGAVNPQRHYFLFGAPMPTGHIDPKDDAATEALYAKLRGEVYTGIERLREIRVRDPYSPLVRRVAWELANQVQAPGPHGEVCT